MKSERVLEFNNKFYPEWRIKLFFGLCLPGWCRWINGPKNGFDSMESAWEFIDREASKVRIIHYREENS